MTTKKTTTGVTVTMVPREMPAPPDRRSVHYPGFDVHLDTHIALPCTRSKARVKADAAAARVQEEGDAMKENVRPVATSALSTSKVKGDIVPRRSARLRTNNNGCVPLQKTIAPDSRGHGRRWTTLHDSYLQL